MEHVFSDPAKLIFLGICFVIVSETMVGIVLFLKAKNFIAHAVTTMASVVGAKVFATSKGGKVYHLDVVYKDGLGQEYKSLIKQGSEAKEGDKVEILYNQNYPAQAKSNNKTQIYFLPLAFMSSVLPMGAVLAMLVMQGIAKVPF